MNKNELVLNFCGIEVVICSDRSELLDRLGKDFSLYKGDLSSSSSTLKITADLVVPDFKKVKGARLFKSSKVEVFEEYPVRYSLYGESGLTIWNQLNDSASVYSCELELLHELVYLFILSRVGKKLDEKGLHRLHASCFLVEGSLFLGLMSSGVGKSTLSAFMSEYSSVSFYSDDSPLITRQGGVEPFALRFGFEENGILPESWKGKETYSLVRRLYGKKRLFSIEDLEIKVGGAYQRKVLLIGKRGADSLPSMNKVSKLRSCGHIVVEGLVGVGLPILVEYFWQKGFKDFLLKTKIFISRLVAFSRLVISSEVYEFKMCSEPKKNAALLIEWAKTTKGTYK